MKYFIIAGEASGDLHAAHLMKELRCEDSEAEFRCFGGDLMEQEGGRILKHYREMAFMGFIPVVMNLRTILQNMQFCKEAIREFAPDVVILVDYPGFNLKIAEFVKKNLSAKVFYYISPKIWAWKEYRIGAIRRYVDRMYCILPFETEFYRDHQYEIDYVGNPSLDEVDHFQKNYTEDFESFASRCNLASSKPLIALLPGSRKQEIEKNLQVMIEVAREHADYQIVIAGAPSIDREMYAQFTQFDNVSVVSGETFALLSHAHAALVTSGTATLETALFNVPQVVCYQIGGGSVANFLFKHLFNIRFISLVNLIADREVVRELLAAEFSVENVRTELAKILNPIDRDIIFKGYSDMRVALGEAGAPCHAAQLMVARLKK